MVPVDESPGPSAQQYAAEPGLLRRSDVVLEAVADVRGRRRIEVMLLDQLVEERHVWVIHADGFGSGDEVDRQVGFANESARAGGLVAGDADEVAGPVQLVAARPNVGIEVAGVEELPQAGVETLLALGG